MISAVSIIMTHHSTRMRNKKDTDTFTDNSWSDSESGSKVSDNEELSSDNGEVSMDSGTKS